jgi:AcrR family transcriptional regulator
MKKNPCAGQKGRPRCFDADEALEKAMHVFWRKGYLGTSLSDLTEAMGINRPSLYAAYGNKESLFRKVLARYSCACGTLRAALEEPTARGVAEALLRQSVEMQTGNETPAGCLAVQSTLSMGDEADPLKKELLAQRAAAEDELRKRFKRAVDEGDLPADADPAVLARFLYSVTLGMAVLAAAGATRKQLLPVAEQAMHGWPS